MFKRFFLISFFALLVFSSLTLCKDESGTAFLNNIKEKITNYKEKETPSTLEKIQEEASQFVQKIQEIPNTIKETVMPHSQEPSTLEKIQDGASQFVQKIQEIPNTIKETVMPHPQEKSTLEKTQEVIIDTAGQIKEKIDEMTTVVNNIAEKVQQKYEENAPKTSYDNIKELINEKLAQKKEDKKEEKENGSTFGNIKDKIKAFILNNITSTTTEEKKGIMSYIQNGYNALKLKMGL